MKIAYAYPVNGLRPKAYSTSDNLNDKLASLSADSGNDSKSAKTLVLEAPPPETQRALREAIDKFINNPLLNRVEVQQDDVILTNSKEHAEKMKQAGVKARYVSDKVQRAVNKWDKKVFFSSLSQGQDSYPHFINVLKQVNQLEKKFGLDDFSLNIKLKDDRLVISGSKIDHQLKARLEKELNKDSLDIKDDFKKLLNYVGERAYRHLIETNGTMRWNESAGDAELSNLTAFTVVVSERFEKTGKIELPPTKSPYGSNNLTHLTLQDFYLYESDLKNILSDKYSNYYFINHFKTLSKHTTGYMLEHLDAKQYILHDRFGYLNYKQKGSAVNETV